MRFLSAHAWGQFMNVQRERQREQVVAREAVVHAVALDAPTITHIGTNLWMAVMPVMQSFHRQGKQMASVVYDVSMQIRGSASGPAWTVINLCA